MAGDVQRTDWAADAWRDYEIVDGYYKMRRPAAYAGEHWRFRDWLPVCIFFAEPDEPAPHWRATLDQDRTPVVVAILDNREVDINTVWPWCMEHPITEAEHEEMTRRLQTLRDDIEPLF